MNLGFSNGWGIVRTIVDLVRNFADSADRTEEEEGESASPKDRKYVLVKDPNKPVIRLYEIPLHTFEDDDDGLMGAIGEADGAGEDGGDE